jgi:hypothetical protein
VETWEDLMSRSDAELARTDPLVMNLLVARGIPSLAQLNIDPYRRKADHIAADIQRRLPSDEREFWKTPEDWANCIHLFRLGVMCQYLDQDVGIAYKEDQRELKQVSYTDPNDLFLTGVLDTLRGTCGSMAELHLALGWRLGWPVSLTLVKWHCMLRFDNGQVVWNLEATDTGRGGFSCRDDAYHIEKWGIDPAHIRGGADLVTLTPRQVLGVFIGSRARHYFDTRRVTEARRELALALRLYPQSRAYRGLLASCHIWESVGHVTFNDLGSERPAVGQGVSGEVFATAAVGASNCVTFGTGFTEGDMGSDFARAVAFLKLPPLEAQGFSADDANLYRYVKNDPTNLTDPSGLLPEDADKPPLRIFGGDVTPENFAAGLQNKTIKLVEGNIGKISLSAALENWRLDDSDQQKQNPTVHIRLTASVGEEDKVGIALLRQAYWLQIGRVDRYTEKKGKLDNNGKYEVAKFRKGTDEKAEAGTIEFGTPFLDGPVLNSPYMTDHGKSGYKRTKTELTFWDAPSALPALSDKYKYIVQSYTAFLVIDGQAVYQVDWGVENHWNGGGGKQKREYIPPTGKIPTELPKFLSDPKGTLYRASGGGVFSRFPEIANPITKIHPEVRPAQ